MPLPIIVIGGGGHAKVVATIIRITGGYEIIGYTDPQKNSELILEDIKYLGTDHVLPDFFVRGITLAAMGVAGMNNNIRRVLYNKIVDLGFNFPVLCHPAAVVAPQALVGKGTVIMAGAVINPGVLIEDNVVINTGAIIEHDCKIGHSAQIAPGAILCGNVTVEPEAFIGAGACIIQGITIGGGALVGAGSIVVKDVPAGVTVVGNPAKPKLN